MPGLAVVSTYADDLPTLGGDEVIDSIGLLDQLFRPVALQLYLDASPCMPSEIDLEATLLDNGEDVVSISRFERPYLHG